MKLQKQNYDEQISKVCTYSVNGEPKVIKEYEVLSFKEQFNYGK